VRRAAAREPVPGSGSVAAAVGALGAGLASMALGSARGEGSSGASAELGARMEALLSCVQADADAYRAYLEARAGGGALEHAVERSIAVPTEIATLALGGLEGLVSGLATVRSRLHSEAVTGAQALLAAVEGATFTARSNLSGLADLGARERHAAELEGLVTRARAAARALHDLLPAPAR